MPLKTGTILDDRYRVTGRLGHGCMSEVYEATDIISRRIVAVKMIREDVMKNPLNFRRFENEATIAASLRHINIVQVFDHGTIEDRPYIINEYISGQTLKDVLDFIFLSEALVWLNSSVSKILGSSLALACSSSRRSLKFDDPNNLPLLCFFLS